jgi:hypothetical protein
MPKPEDKIGPYTLVKKLGRGAFGVVWLAERRGLILTTKVALKLPIEAPNCLFGLLSEGRNFSNSSMSCRVISHLLI